MLTPIKATRGFWVALEVNVDSMFTRMLVLDVGCWMLDVDVGC